MPTELESRGKCDSPLQSTAMQMESTKPYRVLFVCMGNICRSPTAEAMLRDMAKQRGLDAALSIDSAGTHGYHIGKPPDKRSVKAAKKRGLSMAGIRSRAFSADDFNRYDLILAADRQNYHDIEAQRPAGNLTEVKMILDFLPEDCGLTAIDEVPDPYSGGNSGFERVLDLLELACTGFLDQFQGK